MHCIECGGPLVHRRVPMPPEEIEVAAAFPPAPEVVEASAADSFAAPWAGTPYADVENVERDRAPGTAAALEEVVCQKCGTVHDIAL